MNLVFRILLILVALGLTVLGWMVGFFVQVLPGDPVATNLGIGGFVSLATASTSALSFWLTFGLLWCMPMALGYALHWIAWRLGGPGLGLVVLFSHFMAAFLLLGGVAAAAYGRAISAGVIGREDVIVESGSRNAIFAGDMLAWALENWGPGISGLIVYAIAGIMVILALRMAFFRRPEFAPRADSKLAGTTRAGEHPRQL